MKQAGRVVGTAITAYYGFMLSIYLSREVQGAPLSRFIRVAIVAYYTLMISAYLSREGFAASMLPETPPAAENGGGRQPSSPG